MIGADEKISLKEALYAYTMGGAKANASEDLVGSIEVGKKADFIILNKSCKIQWKEDEKYVFVSKTFIDGNIVYQNDLQ